MHTVAITWTAPDGSTWNLMNTAAEVGVVVRAGIAGWGAAPREVTRQARATGGTTPRWSRADERLITLPLFLHAPDHPTFLRLRRDLTGAFLATTPAAGPPRPGTLRVTRADGTWRQIDAVYLDGLGWDDPDGRGVVADTPVVQLVAGQAWYGAVVTGPRIDAGPTRNYLAPYETVSPDAALGEYTITVDGDAATPPVWTLAGPAAQVTAAVIDGPHAPASWTYGPINPNQTITIDVAASTVTDATGANRIGGLDWPTSTLWWLHPGPNRILLGITGGIHGQSFVELTYRPQWETA